jgi:hypothetical protein
MDRQPLIVLNDIFRNISVLDKVIFDDTAINLDLKINIDIRNVDLDNDKLLLEQIIMYKYFNIFVESNTHSHVLALLSLVKDNIITMSQSVKDSQIGQYVNKYIHTNNIIDSDIPLLKGLYLKHGLSKLNGILAIFSAINFETTNTKTIFYVPRVNLKSDLFPLQLDPIHHVVIDTDELICNSKFNKNSDNYWKMINSLKFLTMKPSFLEIAKVIALTALPINAINNGIISYKNFVCANLCLKYTKNKAFAIHVSNFENVGADNTGYYIYDVKDATRYWERIRDALEGIENYDSIDRVLIYVDDYYYKKSPNGFVSGSGHDTGYFYGLEALGDVKDDEEDDEENEDKTDATENNQDDNIEADKPISEEDDPENTVDNKDTKGSDDETKVPNKDDSSDASPSSDISGEDTTNNNSNSDANPDSTISDDDTNSQGTDESGDGTSDDANFGDTNTIDNGDDDNIDNQDDGSASSEVSDEISEDENSQLFIPLIDSKETLNDHFVRLAVAKLNGDIKNDPQYSSETKAYLDEWCKLWLFTSSIDATKTLLTKLGLNTRISGVL